MKCKQKKCHGLVLLFKIKGVRIYKCNKCNKEYFVYRGARRNQRMEV